MQICLRVEIDETEGSAVLDFAGTGCEVRGNLNSPISVVHSAVIYCMRSMLNLDIPLNAGCLVPLDSTLPATYLCLL
jgi:5-oxoprolinase (ATP-hydrolysing)